MSSQNGITTNSYQRILMGPGAVYIGIDQSALLGATKGGNMMEINRVFRDIRPDGALGKTKGYRFLESVEATLTVRLMEVTEANVTYALAGSTLNSHVITGGEIAAASYIDEVSIVAEVKGITAATEASSVAIAMTNCLVEGPLTIDLPDSGDAIIELKFVGHFNPASMTTEPWEITFTPVSA